MDNNGDAVRRSWFQWFRYITVEPGMFLYMFAFQLTTVIEQELFVMKTCLSNLNFTHEICDNLSSPLNEFHRNEVQVSDIYSMDIIVWRAQKSAHVYWVLFSLQKYASTFHQWNHIAGYIFPVVIAFFMGSWSDKRGRKIPLLIGMIGKLIYTLALLLNIYYGNIFLVSMQRNCFCFYYSTFHFSFSFMQKNGQLSISFIRQRFQVL